MQTRERKEAVAPKIESGGKEGREEQGDCIFLGRDSVKATQRFLRGCEKGEVCFLARRSPFPYWARFLVGGAPPLGAVDWTNSFQIIYASILSVWLAFMLHSSESRILPGREVYFFPTLSLVVLTQLLLRWAKKSRFWEFSGRKDPDGFLESFSLLPFSSVESK